MKDRYLWAWIASIPGIGPRRFDQLSLLFPDLHDLWKLSHSQLALRGVSPLLAACIVRHRALTSPQGIQEYCVQHEIDIVTREDAAYPSLLKEIPDPPIVLYVWGNLPDDLYPKIAVVGTRNITEYGADVTRMITRSLVEKGFVIVSGFMYGVDAQAHKEAMAAYGKTIGVLGFGFEHMYPSEHRALAKDMIACGNCLVTEYAPWQPPSRSSFPARNRIVSGMSVGVVVTEAARRSGSKITASLAVDQGREVFAVPGPIHSHYSEGTKELVNIGATLITSADDIMEELGGLVQYTTTKEPTV